MIFTDRSVCGGLVGSGTSAAVLVPVSENQEVQVRTAAVGCRVSNFECEVDAIILGINMAIQYVHALIKCKAVEHVYIFCDCLHAIECIDKM